VLMFRPDAIVASAFDNISVYSIEYRGSGKSRLQ